MTDDKRDGDGQLQLIELAELKKDEASRADGEPTATPDVDPENEATLERGDFQPIEEGIVNKEEAMPEEEEANSPSDEPALSADGTPSNEDENGSDDDGDLEGSEDDDQDDAVDDDDDDDFVDEAVTWVGDRDEDSETSDASESEERFIPTLDELARDPRLSRLAGAVLGASIGDAMGHPTEFIGSFDAIRRRFGPDGVTAFELYRDGPRGRFAPFTDDTQMAEVVLRSLLWARENGADLDATMVTMGKGFIEWAKHPKGGHRAPGNACLSGCRALERGVHWSRAGGPKAGGCGSVMRAYPFGLVFAEDLGRAERWSAEHSRLTHGDPIALAASAAMAVGMARIYRGEPIDLVLSEMVAAACRYSPRTAAMMAEAIDEAVQGVEPEVTLQRLQGWAAHEAIAAAVYLFARHPDSPRRCILEAANTPGDSDSLATLAGALTGCRCGIGSVPEEWIRDVERSNEFLSLACRIP